MMRCSILITGAPVLDPARRTEVLERHSYVYGFGKKHHPQVVAACKLRKAPRVQCSARSYISPGSISIPFRLRELGTSVSESEFTPVLLQPGQLSRTSTEGEADGWILTPSLNEVALGARSSAGNFAHLRGGILDPADNFGNSVRRDVGVASNLIALGDAESLTNVQDADAGAKSEDFFQGVKDVFKRAQTLKEEVTSLDFNVAPTPYAPNEGPDAIKFALLSVTLLFIFWLGNYYVPDQIFNRTVFKKPDEPNDPNGKASDENMLTVSNQQSTEDSTGAIKSKTDESERSSSKMGSGFGRRKERRVRSSKRK